MPLQAGPCVAPRQQQPLRPCQRAHCQRGATTEQTGALLSLNACCQSGRCSPCQRSLAVSSHIATSWPDQACCAFDASSNCQPPISSRRPAITTIALGWRTGLRCVKGAAMLRTACSAVRPMIKCNMDRVDTSSARPHRLDHLRVNMIRRCLILDMQLGIEGSHASYTSLHQPLALFYALCRPLI